MKAVAPTTFARMSESLMSRKPLHKRLSRGFATCRSLPPSMGKNCRQKLPGGWPQGCEMPGEGSSLLVGVAVALRAPVLSSLLARLRRSRPAEPTCAATPRQFRDPGRSLSWVCRSHARDERPRHETQVGMVDAFAACLNLLDGHLSDTSLLCPPNRVKLR